MILDLFRGYSGEMTSELEVALENPETDVLFDSFLLERKERPCLLDLIKTEQTFKDYLSLPVECRAEVESLRLKDPEYLAGDFERDAPIWHSTHFKGSSGVAFDFFKRLRTENAIQKITDQFVKFQPENRKGAVGLRSWFDDFNPSTGEQLEVQVKGEVKTFGVPQGKKIYSQYARYTRTGKQSEGINFDDWIMQRITPELKEKLMQTKYFSQNKLSISDIVKLFIEHQPSGKHGPASLSNWFQRYNPQTGVHLKTTISGEFVSTGVPAGASHYVHYLHSQQRKAGVSFDDFIMEQIPFELRECLKQTTYFTQEQVGIDDVVKAYIKHQPSTQRGPTPLTAWFVNYDISTGKNTKNEENNELGPPKGNKYYLTYMRSDDKKKGVSFDDWVLSQLSPELKEQVLQTKYFQQEKFGVEDVVRAYVKFQPVYRNSPVSLTNWFQRYDICSGALLKQQVAGKNISSGNPQGNKFYQSRSNLDARHNGISFDDWILSQLEDDELKAELQSTPYWRSKYDS